MDEDTFVRRLVEWQPFYSTVAAAAATLTGLLFVALSINRDRLTTEAHGTFRRLARQSFGDFLFVLSVAMVMLVPKQGPTSVAVTLFLLGVYRMVRLVQQPSNPAYRHAGSHRLMRMAMEYALSLGSCLGLCAVAIAIGLGHYRAIYFLVFILIELVSAASRSAWQLLMLDGPPVPDQ